MTGQTPETFRMIEALEKGGVEYEAKVTDTARALLAYEGRMGRRENESSDWDEVSDRTRRVYREAAEKALLAAGVL